MNAPLERTTTLAYAGMILSLWLWHPPLVGPLASLPLLACVPWMLALNGRAFVLGGAFALPYLSYAIVEIVSDARRPPGAIALLACGVVFMGLLLPAIRRLRARRRGG